MTGRTGEEVQAEVAAPAPAGPAVGGTALATVFSGPTGTDRILSLQRTAGNTRTSRAIARWDREHPAPQAATQAPAADDFEPVVPNTTNPDVLFRTGVQLAHSLGDAIEHVVVLTGSAMVADASGRHTGNFALRGNFSLRPGFYVITGSGSIQYGRRGGRLTSRRFGYSRTDLPEELRGPGRTIYFHDWIQLTEEQERRELGNCVVIVPPEAPAPQQGGDQQAGGQPAQGDQATEGATAVPATAQPGYGSEVGHEGGRTAQQPSFPARLQASASQRGGNVVAQGSAGLPFVYQPVGGAATFTMVLDYSSASPGFLLGQASAASRLHLYRWELWEITASHDEAIAGQAQQDRRARPGSGRQVGATDAAHEDLRRASGDLDQRPAQYAQEQAQAVAEGRYFDALAGEINQDLLGVESLFRYGSEVLGLAADAAGTGRERRVPIAREGVYLVRCIAHYDPYARGEGRPDRVPSVATMIVKVRAGDWLSRDAVGEQDAQADEVALQVALRRRQLQGLGRPPTAEEAQSLADLETRLVEARRRAGGRPLDVLEAQLHTQEAELARARERSHLPPEYEHFDPEVDRLRHEVDALRGQLGHAQTQARELAGPGAAARTIYRVRGSLVSRVTGETYQLLLSVNEPAQAGAEWECTLADSTSRSGEYHHGRGADPTAAVWRAVEALAGNPNGFGEGSLTVRLPQEGPWAAVADERLRTHTVDTRARDWAAARQRLEEVATILGLVAMVVAPEAGAVAAALGAAVSAARLIERARNDTLEWDAELVSDVLSILGGVATGVSTIGRLSVVRANGRFVLAMQQDAVRIRRLAGMTEHFNDWFLNPAGIIWGNLTLAAQALEIDNQVATGRMTSTDARRQRAQLLMSALNTNIQLIPHGHGGGEEGTRETPPEHGTTTPHGETATTTATTTPPATHTETPPAGAGGDHVIPPGGGGGGGGGGGSGGDGPPRRTPHEAFRAALEGGQPAAAEARALALEVGDWRGALRQAVNDLPPAHRAAAARALAEARAELVNSTVREASERFGVDQRNWGTPGFGSDIDLTITPRERLPGFAGHERPVADQIRAASDAADWINARLRERVGGDPANVIDTNVYAYIGEDRVTLGTPEQRARAGALEAEIGLAEARRGLTDEQWHALQGAIERRLSGPEGRPGEHVEAAALGDLRQRAAAGERTEAALRAERERAEAVVREHDPALPAAEVARQARDAVLSEKRRQLADLFAARDPDPIAILRLQAEIRWFAPDAYAGGAAFEYAVGFGQARRGAGGDAAQAAGRAEPTRADVLADLAANLGREGGRSPQDRMALLAGAAASQLGMLGAHTHGTPAERVKAAAKYGGRILDLFQFANLGVSGPIPEAFSRFSLSRWSYESAELPAQLQLDMLGRYAESVGLAEQVRRGENGLVSSVSDDVRLRFAADVATWATDATARLMTTERTMPQVEAPAAPATPAAPHTPPPAAPAPEGGGPAPTGGLRGQTYDLTNTASSRGAEIGGLERGSGEEKVRAAVRRLQLQEGVTLTAPSGTGFTLRVTLADGRVVDVPVTVAIRPSAQLSPSEHGAEGGPARLIPTSSTDAAGTVSWRARIEVDSRLHPEDLSPAISHESNELIGLVQRFPAGAPDAGVAGEMRASVFLPGSTATTPTAHDRAALLELRQLVLDYQNLVNTPTTSADRLGRRERSIERLRTSMGLTDPANLDLKLRLLREAGFPDSEIAALRLVGAAAELGAHTAAETAAGRAGPSIFDPELVSHLMFPEEQGGFIANGIYGGHLTRRLLDFCAAHPLYAVVAEGAPRTVAGTTWRRFAQYRWKDPSRPKPAPGHPDHPQPGGVYNPALWELSTQPKTTADDMGVYLREGESAWRNWVALHDGGPAAVDAIATTGRSFGGPGGTPPPAVSANGVNFGGFYANPGPGNYELGTMFIDAAWVP